MLFNTWAPRSADILNFTNNFNKNLISTSVAESNAAGLAFAIMCVYVLNECVGMNVCMYVCIYVCICMYVCMYVYMYVYMYVLLE